MEYKVFLDLNPKWRPTNAVVFKRTRDVRKGVWFRGRESDIECSGGSLQV